MLPFTYVFRHALAWLVQKEGVTIYICVSVCTGMVGSEGGCYYLHMCFGMHWHGWFRRRVLPFTYVFRHALAWLVQKEDVTIYICVSVCTGMVGSEGGCYHLHMCFGMHWHGWFRRRVLPFTYVFRHALAWLIQKEGVTIYICVSVCTGMVGSEGGCYHLHMCFGMHWHGWFRRRVLPFTYVFRHGLAWLVQKEDVTISCVSACTGMVDSEGGCYHLHMCFGMHWHGWFRRRMLPFTYVFRYALAWLVQKEDVTIYICVSACTGMVDSEGGCYHLHMCFGMHWHGWFRRRVLPFTYVFRYALAWLVQKEGVTIYICVSACTGMVGSDGGVLPFPYVFRHALAWLVQKEDVTIYICVSDSEGGCTGMVGSEGGCYHLHMCFGMHWHGWFRRRVLPFTYVFRYALAWLIQKEGVTIYICVSACTVTIYMVAFTGRRRVLPFTYVFRHALAWLVQKEDVTIYICVSACTGHM